MLRLPSPVTFQWPGSAGVSLGIGDPGAIAVEKVTLISEVPFTEVRPRAGEYEVTWMGGGGCVEVGGLVVELVVALVGGTDVDVPGVWCGDDAGCRLVTTAAAIPAPTRTVAATANRRSGVNVTVQRRGESATASPLASSDRSVDG